MTSGQPYSLTFNHNSPAIMAHKPSNLPRERETSSRRWFRRCSLTAFLAFNSLPKLVKMAVQLSGINIHVYAKFLVSSLEAGSANSATSCLSFSAQICSSCMNCFLRRPLRANWFVAYTKHIHTILAIIFDVSRRRNYKKSYHLSLDYLKFDHKSIASSRLTSTIPYDLSYDCRKLIILS